MGRSDLSPSSPAMTIEDELRKCFKCGMCRAVCPVLAEELLETAGPRAKVALCEALLDGSIGLTEATVQLLRRCTGCRSCSMSCTSGTDPRSLAVALGSELGGSFGPPPVPAGRVGSLLIDTSMDGEKDLDQFRERSARGEIGVAYFVGCVEASHLRGVPENVLEVISKLGVTVAVPDGQVCCGWPQVLLGDLGSARELALQNRKALGSFQVVLTSCVHCQSMLTRDYPSLFGISELASRTGDVLGFMGASGLLAGLKLDFGAERVLYSHACRLGRGRAKDTSHVLFLRERLAGALVESERDRCCGAPLEVHSPETARRMLEGKTTEIKQSGCGIVLADCPFCVLALEPASEVPVKHLLAGLSL